METLDIRRLSPGDADWLRALNTLFAEAFADPETYAGDPPSTGYLEGLLAKPHVVALAAIANQQVVGGLVAYELDKFERERSEIYIYDLAVTEAWRRRGIASGLIASLQAIGRARGAWVVFVQGDYGDDPALALYDKLGKREEVLHFDLPID